MKQSFLKRFPPTLGLLIVVATGLLLMPQQLKVQLQQEFAKISSPLIAVVWNVISSRSDQILSNGDDDQASEHLNSKLPSKGAWSDHLKWLNAEHLSHIAFFVICTLLLLIWLPLPYASIAMIVYAAATEALQYFSPGRTADLQDVYANVLGVAIALFLYIVLRQTKHGVLYLSAMVKKQTDS